MNTRSKSGLFLIELTVVILVFALSAATCLNIFFQSRQIASESRDLGRASQVVQTVADCYKSEAGDLAKTAATLGGELDSPDTLRLDYDKNWQRTGDGAAFSVVLMSLTEGECIIAAQVASTGAPIFSVTVRGGLDLG